MRKQLLDTAVAGILLVLTAGTVPGLAAQELRIRGIELCGIKHVGKGEIRNVMNTPFPSFFAFIPWVKLPAYDATMLREDERNIKTLYESKGYYQAAVTTDVKADASRQTVRIRICVDEGRQATVEDVEIVFSSPIAAGLREGAAKVVRLRKGKPFETQTYQDSKRGIEEYLGNNGYPDAKANGQAVVNRDTLRARITFSVETGTLQHFGKITIAGLVQVREKDIFREITFKPGETFSAAKLYQSQRNIYDLGTFDSVALNSVSRNTQGVIPIGVTVSETKKRRLELGAGYGTEDRLRARASWSRLYFLNRVSTFGASLRFSSLLWSGSVGYTQPYFLAPGTNLGGRFGYDREFNVSYSNEKVSSQVRLGRRLSPSTLGYVAYDLELNRPLSVVPSVREMLLAANPGDYYFISAVMFGIDWGTVGNTLDPRRGMTFSLASEVSTFLLASSVDYVKMYAEARSFHEVLPEYVLAARAMGGFINPSRSSQVIPIFKRYFLGGSTSVRGYPYQGIGPLNSAGDPLGGDYLVLGNLELRYPVYKKLRGIVFVDGGNVYATSFDFSFANLKYSTGIGARYETPVGPVRLDLAFPLDTTGFSLSRYSVYVSLGPMF